MDNNARKHWAKRQSDPLSGRARFGSDAQAGAPRAIGPVDVQCNVSIIVPTFNRALFLGESLASLLNQTVQAREILVVDDGSSDDTSAVVTGFGDRVRYLRQENGGKATALNLGLRHASEETVWIFDDDDLAEPDALQHLWAALAADPSAGFAFADYDNFRDEPDGSRRYIPAPKARFEPGDLFYALLERCFIFQPALLVRRNCYDAVGPFDPSLTRAQDYEMLLRLALRFRGVHVPTIAFHQRAHEGQRGSAREPIDGRMVWERQKSFNARVFEGLYEACALADFLPPAERSSRLDPHARLRALVRRGAAMARTMLWAQAIADFKKAAELAERHRVVTLPAAERACLNRVFDEHGPASELDRSNPLLLTIARLPRSRFRDNLLRALLWPAFRYLVKSARKADVRRVRDYIDLYRHFGDFATLPRHVGQAVRNQVRRVTTKPGLPHAA